jgi:hypothetical protein
VPDAVEFGKTFGPDALIVAAPEQAVAALSEFDEAGPAVLVSVFNPLGEALQAGSNPNDQTFADPQGVSEALEEYAQSVRNQMETALDAGADGIFYRIVGANPRYSTPMQYGGFHLEMDRSLLASVQEAPFNVVLAEGEDVYLEFLTDLPVHALAWESGGTSLSVADVRKMRSGAIACCLGDAWEGIVCEIGRHGLILAGRFDPHFDYRAFAQSLLEDSSEVVS